MKLTIITVDGCCDSIRAECTPIEWIIIDKALKMMVNNKETREKDRRVAEWLIATEPKEQERSRNACSD